MNASLGLMLETVSPRLTMKGKPHFSAPDKHPEVRLRMLREAGELSIASRQEFSSGLEKPEMKLSTVSSLFVTSTKPTVTSRKLLSRTFRAKADTRMAEFPEPDAMEIAKTVAVARRFWAQT